MGDIICFLHKRWNQINLFPSILHKRTASDDAWVHDAEFSFLQLILKIQSKLTISERSFDDSDEKLENY